jgi:TRAP-type C4-dicarboxylate transport system permease small subunit
MYFIGAALVYKRRRDIEILTFYVLLGKSTKKAVSIITNAASFYFLVVLVYFAFKLLLIQSKYSTEGLGIPTHYFSMPLFVGALSMLLILLEEIIRINLEIEDGYPLS